MFRTRLSLWNWSSNVLSSNATPPRENLVKTLLHQYVRQLPLPKEPQFAPRAMLLLAFSNIPLGSDNQCSDTTVGSLFDRAVEIAAIPRNTSLEIFTSHLLQLFPLILTFEKVDPEGVRTLRHSLTCRNIGAVKGDSDQSQQSFVSSSGTGFLNNLAIRWGTGVDREVLAFLVADDIDTSRKADEKHYYLSACATDNERNERNESSIEHVSNSKICSHSYEDTVWIALMKALPPFFVPVREVQSVIKHVDANGGLFDYRLQWHHLAEPKFRTALQFSSDGNCVRVAARDALSNQTTCKENVISSFYGAGAIHYRLLPNKKHELNKVLSFIALWLPTFFVPSELLKRRYVYLIKEYSDDKGETNNEMIRAVNKWFSSYESLLDHPDLSFAVDVKTEDFGESGRLCPSFYHPERGTADVFYLSYENPLFFFSRNREAEKEEYGNNGPYSITIGTDQHIEVVDHVRDNDEGATNIYSTDAKLLCILRSDEDGAESVALVNISGRECKKDKTSNASLAVHVYSAAQFLELAPKLTIEVCLVGLSTNYSEEDSDRIVAQRKSPIVEFLVKKDCTVCDVALLLNFCGFPWSYDREMLNFSRGFFLSHSLSLGGVKVDSNGGEKFTDAVRILFLSRELIRSYLISSGSSIGDFVSSLKTFSDTFACNYACQVHHSINFRIAKYLSNTASESSIRDEKILTKVDGFKLNNLSGEGFERLYEVDASTDPMVSSYAAISFQNDNGEKNNNKERSEDSTAEARFRPELLHSMSIRRKKYILRHLQDVYGGEIWPVYITDEKTSDSRVFPSPLVMVNGGPKEEENPSLDQGDLKSGEADTVETPVEDFLTPEEAIADLSVGKDAESKTVKDIEETKRTEPEENSKNGGGAENGEEKNDSEGPDFFEQLLDDFAKLDKPSSPRRTGVLSSAARRANMFGNGATADSKDVPNAPGDLWSKKESSQRSQMNSEEQEDNDSNRDGKQFFFKPSSDNLNLSLRETERLPNSSFLGKAPTNAYMKKGGGKSLHSSKSSSSFQAESYFHTKQNNTRNDVPIEKVPSPLKQNSIGATSGFGRRTLSLLENQESEFPNLDYLSSDVVRATMEYNKNPSSPPKAAQRINSEVSTETLRQLLATDTGKAILRDILEK